MCGSLQQGHQHMSSERRAPRVVIVEELIQQPSRELPVCEYVINCHGAKSWRGLALKGCAWLVVRVLLASLFQTEVAIWCSRNRACDVCLVVRHIRAIHIMRYSSVR